MKRFYIIGFTLLLIFDTLGQTGFKLTALSAAPLDDSFDWVLRVFSTHWLYMTILSYMGAFFTWMILLKKVPVGPAFAASHLQIVTVMVVSIWLFNENISWVRGIGAILIMAGIVFLALAENKIHLKKDNSTIN